MNGTKVGFENIVFNNSVITDEMIRAFYPPQTEDVLKEDKSDPKSWFTVNTKMYFRENTRCEPYIDVYIKEKDPEMQDFSRFLICQDYCYDRKTEKLLIRLIRKSLIAETEEMMDELFSRVSQHFPKLNFVHYNRFQASEAVYHLYYALHNGPRRILYETGLHVIPYFLDFIPEYNVLGTSAETIIGHEMPLRLLRILDNRGLIENLCDEASMDHSRHVYETYSGYIENLPCSCGQWKYLEMLHDNGTFGGKPFIRALFNRLSAEYSEVTLESYERFLFLRENIKSIRKRIKLPKPDRICEMVENLDALVKIGSSEKIDAQILKLYYSGKNYYEYSNDTYVVVMPSGIADFINEAVTQRNCLMEYVEKYITYQTVILFVRKRDCIKEPFVTIEIDNNQEIVQVRERFNHVPDSIDLFSFMAEYAEKKGFDFNPLSLVKDMNDDGGYDNCPQDIFEFSLDYNERKKGLNSENEKQLTLADFFPEIFGRCF